MHVHKQAVTRTVIFPSSYSTLIHLLIKTVLGYLNLSEIVIIWMSEFTRNCYLLNVQMYEKLLSWTDVSLLKLLEDSRHMSSPAAREALDAGWTSEQVRRAVNQILTDLGKETQSFPNIALTVYKKRFWKGVGGRVHEREEGWWVSTLCPLFNEDLG